MFKYNFFIGLLGILIFSVVLVSFSLMGSPFSQQAIRKDQQRYKDFETIKSATQSYFATNNKLPDSLNVLYQFAKKTDPDTGKSYGYKVLSSIKYQLCANFSFDSRNKRYETLFSMYKDEIPYNHKKGYDCLTLTIPQTYKTKTNSNLFEMPTPTPIPQIIGYWSFDDDENLTNSVYDGSGIFTYHPVKGMLNSAILNNIKSVKGKIGQAVSFSGSKDSYIEISNTALINKTIKGDFSLSLWANRISTEGNAALISNTNSYDGGFALIVGDKGEIYCRTSDGKSYSDSYTDYEGGYLLGNNGWHYITLVREKNICLVYVDGVDRTLVKSDHINIKENNNSLIIGGLSVYNSMFQGHIDEVEFYNYVLSPTEVESKYNSFE
ncbi:hypothetical protein A2954_01745 [Candidatus Roizmanbacteria bacterium RIFCSPLOWO2_01_FULL_37_12]|uniref:LamG-like jellyroll fold domain-containing protein n=1 Tax=Candidatus Roizmanbacteria bacterium RIFCSPLOWO2_01_FULL_37_12 TaxID=1802056 RepID=A0A1F7I9D3_9BACT|nr:MAG: hypothetical protein A2768_01045 [Candidatus Roizmanbacteria bacterium RIFCSPHIGHO2_01_FULL_37_16]OGK23110.1 MAG: hypothetical protein A3D76_05890 [Candidatus Roizmanbacteria bacterium RIFCSPHIGHO2_02_FULL_37_9b]OGK39971.1 MAG: hypothetical protein A2954_01745 [Candidatus Roizmanbacteria bacterium RIFCSPLOWO2_01_FULL_37_12]